MYEHDDRFPENFIFAGKVRPVQELIEYFPKVTTQSIKIIQGCDLKFVYRSN